MIPTLKIGQLAKLSSTTTKTIRYYELLGLLHEPERTTPTPCSSATSLAAERRPPPCWTNPWPSPASWACGR